ncbi:MAG TPA: AbrB/MazE/SpoVT family DNA-binding domain-containing protein [Chloroflexota bacterium]|nr:AbrB/MazE/SpoVT family DNA-binding domain-containing protein [Chloroflexota bacterium]
MTVRELHATITTRGQITLPAEVQRRLGLKPHDRVVFAIDTERDEVTLRPVSLPLQAVFGSVTPATRTEDFQIISREARDEKAEDEVRTFQDQ